MAVGGSFRFDEVFRNEVEELNARRKAVGRTDLVALEFEDVAPSGEAIPEQAEAATSSPKSGSITAVGDDTRSGREPILRPTADSNVIGLALSGGGVRSASFCLGALQALDKAGVLKNIDYLSTVSGGGYIGTSLSAAMTRSKGTFPFQSSLTQDEPYSVQHIRNHSNYLSPRGSINIVSNLAIYLRGLLANALLLLPWLLFAAAITIFIKPTTDDLHQPRFLGRYVPEALAAGQFSLTLILLYLFVLLLLAWGLWRSLEVSGWAAEIGSHWTKVCAGLLIILLIIGFCELQPIILKGIFESGQQQSKFSTSMVGWLQGLAQVLAPFLAAVALLSRHIGGLLKEGAEKPSFIAVAMRAVGKQAVYVAAAAIPILLWLVYLYFCFLGIKVVGDNSYHAPQWIFDLSRHWFAGFPGDAPIGWFYLVTGFALFVASLLLAPNANSLHRLYRDRLSKAFLFDPTTADENFELAPLDRFKLSEISSTHTPYHLINTALNIRGSKYGRRGRRGGNTDFFLLSPNFVGSESTGYVSTNNIERIAKGFDLATAMTISGAGPLNTAEQTIEALTPVLAIFNMRLGYWLRNPAWVAKAKFRNIWENYYLLPEMLGLLNEHRKSVYLTGGDEIDKLGLYELLRRQCRVIIAIDAEADPDMTFIPFNKLVRYARIDLGIKLDLPSEPITNTNRITNHTLDQLQECKKLKGPHSAIGQISYSNGQNGILVYIKPTLTGDEGKEVLNYRKRNSQFPHESTPDHRFSNEQFEAYRALGHHTVHGLFDRRDDFAKLDTAEFPEASSHAEILDHIFPRVTTGAPGQPQRFAERLTKNEATASVKEVPPPTPPDELLTALGDNTAVLVLGTGASVQAGIPTSQEILRTLLHQLSQELPQGLARTLSDLEADNDTENTTLLRVGGFAKVIDAILSAIPREKVVREIRRILSDARTDSSFHAQLASMPWRGVLSLTWDSVAESVFLDSDWATKAGRWRRFTLEDTNDLPTAIRAGDRLFLLAMGDLNEPTSLSLSLEEFRRNLSRKPEFQRGMAHLLQTHTFLFLGVSPITLEQFLYAVAPELEAGKLRHFTLAPDDYANEVWNSTLSKFGVRILAYQPGTRHQPVVDFIQATKKSLTQRSGPLRHLQAKRERTELKSHRIERIKLENIGLFRSLDLKFDTSPIPESAQLPWTVIFGSNGIGKSTILRAMGLVLVGSDPAGPAAAERLLSAGQRNGMIELDIGSNIVLRTLLTRSGSSVIVRSLQTTPVEAHVALFLGFPALRGGPTPNPSGPATLEHIDPETPDVLPLLSGEADRRLGSFKQWLINTLVSAERGDASGVAVRDLLNGIMRDIIPGDVEAFAEVGTAFTIAVRMRAREKISTHTESSREEVPFDNLSQGMASIFNWVGVLVQRLVDVYPDSQIPQNEPAVVLIDEIDAHLHPDWQRKLVEVTKRYFPNVQIIASSHSPLIAGALRGKELCVLQRDPETNGVGQLPVLIDTYGMRSHDILTSAIFCLQTDRNPEVERLIGHYFDLYEKANPTQDDKRQLEGLSDTLKQLRYADSSAPSSQTSHELQVDEEALRQYFDKAVAKTTASLGKGSKA